jgi:hypothetical protein
MVEDLQSQRPCTEASKVFNSPRNRS